MTVALGNVEQAFMAALEWRQANGDASIPPTKLDEICGLDPVVRDEVLSLLRHAAIVDDDEEKSGGFLDPAELHGSRGGAMSRDAALEEWGGSAIGQRVGEFIIIGQLGEGGMGIVYLAEQQRPRRPVALKVIRRRLATASMIARFEREAELLGRLSHPGIAQIYAAGIADVNTIDSGPIRVPFIAMELVNGVSILEYVRGSDCPPNAIVQLITQVCEAIQHAHQRGIIHRDLKPANLLVESSDSGPRVKVLDFGVARTIESKLDDDDATTRLTAHGYLIGTPAYMSPEQVQGRSAEVGTQSDVYALGAILFELLSGKPAIDLAGCALHEAARKIIEQEPQRLGAADRRLRGDIETIVAKAIQKDPSLRYQTAADLCRDLRHFLADEPIEAKRDSLIHLLGASAARYRNLLIAMCALMAAFAGFGLYARNQMLHQTQPTRVLVHDSAQANESLKKMADELSASRLERGRLLMSIGDLRAAEDLIWTEYSQRPESPSARAAFWELYGNSSGPPTSSSDGECRAAVTLPSGQLQAIAGAGGLLRISNVGTAGRTISVSTPLQSVLSLQFSANGSQLLAAGADGLLLLDRSDGHEIRRFSGHKGPVTAADLSSDSAMIVSTGDDGTVRLWATRTTTEYQSLALVHSAGRCVRVDRKAARLVATFGDGILMVWSIAWANGKPDLQEIAGFAGKNGIVAGFSPDGSIVAASSEDGRVHLWRSDSGEEIAVFGHAQ